MRASTLVFAAIFAQLGCGGSGEALERTPEPCAGLDVQVIERAVAPPANVAALVSVTDCEGRALGRRLDPTAFELAEDGATLSVHEATREIIPAQRQRNQRTLIALDLSGSIVRSELRPAMIDGALRLASHLTPAGKVAIYGFDGRPDLIPFSDFTSDADALESSLAYAKEAPLVDDSTNLNGAIIGALRVLDRAVEVDAKDPYAVAHGTLVTFTDGRDLAGRVSDTDVDRALANTEHSTFAVGVGDDLDPATMQRIGRTAQIVALDAQGVFDAFDEVARQVKARAEANYIVSYCSPARAGARTLEITVRDKERTGKTHVVFDADGFGAGCSPESSPLR